MSWVYNIVCDVCGGIENEGDGIGWYQLRRNGWQDQYRDKTIHALNGETDICSERCLAILVSMYAVGESGEVGNA